MARPVAKRNRERRESDLLLNVVLAHIAYTSIKDPDSRNAMHERFKDAVRILYRFVVTKEDASNNSHNSTN